MVDQGRAAWNPGLKSITLNERDYRFKSKGSGGQYLQLKVVTLHKYHPSWSVDEAAVLRFCGDGGAFN